MDFNNAPIVIGAVFGVFFLIVVMCIVAQFCYRKSRSERYRQQYGNAAAAGHITVPSINAQFNNPIGAPTHTFAPAANYPMGPGHQYPANLTPHSYQQHYQNFNSGAVSTYTPQPLQQPDAPPSYSEAVGRS